MRKALVGVLAVFVFGIWVTPASAQRVRVGASFRLSDDVAVRWSYPLPHWREVRVRPDYRYRISRYWEGRQRHHRIHRELGKRHGRWHREVDREHERLHRDMWYGYVSAREHRRWHEAVGYDHDDMHDVLEHHHERAHDRGGSPRHSHR